ncbi:hypothetical protein PUR57_06020 [Streptomyces sp. JV176]|uniref:hypothetical protein n=1 Tax=Streptomyces sp. JV176 TaxID=858630 RepID=UPI002E777FAD|nr:hypothetical protein [Streptomyces sp. JV176]MEE1798234.1 hypothetical protein [Streptomyces sp. JV176]
MLEPSLYATDQPSYVVQGWKVTDAEILAKLDVPDGETIVEVPASLFRHLAKDGLSAVVTTWAPPIVHVTRKGTYIVQGERVSDVETLGQMSMPSHEDCVVVSKEAVLALLEENDGGPGHG